VLAARLRRNLAKKIRRSICLAGERNSSARATDDTDCVNFAHDKTDENLGEPVSSSARSAVDYAGARQPSRVARGSTPRRWSESITEELRMKSVTRFFKDESGVTAIEYGLIAALISVVIIAATTLVGTNLNTIFQTIANKLGAA
jgi:pilus assembly protein Flp/PilA